MGAEEELSDAGSSERSEKTEQLIKASQEGSLVWTVKKPEGDGFFNINKSELSSLATFINEALKHDPLVNGIDPILPVQDTSSEIFCASFSDGRLLTSLINLAKPKSIDTSSRLTQLQKSKAKSTHVARKRRQSLMIMEDLNEAISKCTLIPGIVVVNVGALDFVAGKPNIVLGLVWQLVGASFMNKVALRFHPEIVRLLEKDEKLQDFYSLPEDAILLRWINWHLQEAAFDTGTSPLKITNFNRDVKDCRAYNTLISRLDPSLKSADDVSVRERAQHVLDNIALLQVPDVLTTSRDIEKGHTRMNAALFAQIFNSRSGLEPLTEGDIKLVSRIAESQGLQNIADDLIQYNKTQLENRPAPVRMGPTRVKAVSNWKTLASHTGLTDGILHLQEQYGYLAVSDRTLVVEGDDSDDETKFLKSGNRGIGIETSTKTVLLDDTDVSYKDTGIFCFVCPAYLCCAAKREI